jgi:uncharacterized membrane protein
VTATEIGDSGVHAGLPVRDARPEIAADARLRNEVVLAARALTQLLEEREVLGAEVADAIASTVAEVQHRLDRDELAVVVVGEKKAGKSTFLNAILGARVLPTNVRECTGTVTFIQRAPRPTYRATLANGETIQFEDVDWNERQNLALSIENLRQRLDRKGSREPQSDPNERKVALVRAIKEHDLALKQRQEAEGVRREKEARLTTVTVDAEQAERQCKALMAKGVELEEQLVAAHSADVQPITALEAAQERLAITIAAAPFFLRPTTAFFIVLLRWMLQWFFRQQQQAIADAQRDVEVMRLRAADAAERRFEAMQRESDIAAQLEAVRGDLAKAHDRARAIEVDRKGAEEQLTAASAKLAEVERSEDVAKLEMLHLRADGLEEQFFERFRAEVQDLTDMEKRGGDVVELTIGYPSKHLPDGITIIDTPGVNSDNASNRERAWKVIRQEADGCIFVSDLQQVVSKNTREFLQELRAFIPHILLVMSKVDGALANAHVVNVEPWQRVDEARRNGVRRFAKEIGRAPDEVFSIAVAAEVALRRKFSGDLLARRFPSEVARLFQLLEAEKDLVLGARAAAGLRYCVQRITEAETRAEEQYRTRIAELEAHRLPHPELFQAQQLERIEPALRAHAEAIGKRAREAMSAGIDTLAADCIEAIRGCADKDELKNGAAELGKEAQKAIARVMEGVEKEIVDASSEAQRALEIPLLEDLRERYRIVQNISGSAAVLVEVRTVHVAVMPTTAVQANVAGAVSSFEQGKLALGAGGAITGAAIGTLILPGVGTAIGAGVGALAGYLKTLDSLKTDCATAVTSALDDARRQLSEQLGSVAPDVQRTMRDVLSRGLADAVTRFESWIKNVMNDELRHLEEERAKLSRLLERREQLIMHDRTLAAVQRATAKSSRGLSA